MNRNLLLGGVFAAIAIIAVNMYGNLIDSATATDTGAETSSSGEVTIGGAFSLVNQDGKAFTEKDLLGKYSLVFFGFTNCPDVCPTGLLNITKTMEILGTDAEKITPVFITVDYETDTVEKLKKYLESFHPSIQGLTGSEEQLKVARDSYKVYAQKVASGGMMGNMFNHSSYTYLMDKEGKYVKHFQYNTSPEEMAKAIKEYF